MEKGSRRLSREVILDAAFRAWGRTHFMNTSLNLVAAELHVTKPAVYRYFRSKDELLRALRADYAQRLRDEMVSPLEELARRQEGDAPRAHSATPAPFHQAALAYVTAVYTFFERNPFHYAFFVRYLLGQPLELDEVFRETLERHDAILTLYLASSRAVRYIGGAAAFWTTEHYRWDTGTKLPAANTLFDPTPPGKSLRNKTISRVTDRLVSGFLPRDTGEINREMVERIAWFTPEEMPQPDRIFSAIETVVQEQGYAGATVEQIAAQVGITKSSLYHYFRNRNDMLSHVVLRDQQHFASLARVRIQQIEHPREQMYALFVMLASYAAQHSVFRVVENWIRANNISVELPQEYIQDVQSIFTFLLDIIIAAGVTPNPMEAFSTLSFVRFLILQEMNLMRSPPERDDCIAAVRELFHLFACGAAPEGHDL